ncbi:MAG: glycosyltransferase [Deferrisomatales bacterium]|nr:glycosyltransferase [Deferrisomatales bacterium]
MKYSVVFLLEERRSTFPQFVEDTHRVFAELGLPFEILVVDNGTQGYLRELLAAGRLELDNLKCFEFGAATHQSTCLKGVLGEASGETVVVLGSYRQITDDGLRRLLREADGSADIVIPWRRNRVDHRVGQWRSRLFNGIVRTVLGTPLHDVSCTVRVLRREVLERLDLYGGMYRFLPVVAARQGYETLEVPCDHCYLEPEKAHLQGWGLAPSRLLDVLVLYFNTAFARKPLRFFGGAGMTFVAVGALVMVYFFAARLLGDQGIGNRPLLLVAVILQVFGVQLAGLGLLGEIVAFTQGRGKKEYAVAEVLE